MSVDIPWLWNTINGITSGITSFFNSIWESTQQVVNTGQGIFSGLAAFGTQLWDGMIKFGEQLRAGLENAFGTLAEGFVNVSKILGGYMDSSLGKIELGMKDFAQKFYDFGGWIWDSVQYIANVIISILTNVYNTVASWFSGMATSLGTWWGSATDSVNQWWTDMVLGVRGKIRQSIMATITITMTYKAAEKMLDIDFSEGGAGKFMGGFMSILAAPVVGALVGSIVDAMIPTPQTGVFPLVPKVSTFEYTPPQLNIPSVGIQRPTIETISETVAVEIRPVIG